MNAFSIYNSVVYHLLSHSIIILAQHHVLTSARYSIPFVMPLPNMIIKAPRSLVIASGKQEIKL
jgi:hypothetical protein